MLKNFRRKKQKSEKQPQLASTNTITSSVPPSSKDQKATSPLHPMIVSNFHKFKVLLSEKLSITQTQWNHLMALSVENVYQVTEWLNVSSQFLAQLMAHTANLRYVENIKNISYYDGIFTLPFCKNHLIVPYQQQQGRLAFIITNPFDMALMDALKKHKSSALLVTEPENVKAYYLQRRDHPVAVNTNPLNPGTQKTRNVESIVESLPNKYHQTGPLTRLPNDLLKEDTTENAPPLIQLVNTIIENAIKANASDIHIERHEHAVIVKYRVDGELEVFNEMPLKKLIVPMIARLKIMGNLDISERRVPQDGRIEYKRFNSAFNYDLRLSTVPFSFGEKAVMRIINRNKVAIPMDSLGFSYANLMLYQEKIKTPYGMILHVGPTGSGKSMSLYAAMAHIHRPGINISTAEDPIEYILPGINQLQINREQGLTFARALRAFLRQDPDVILVGEIRDRETAQIAVEASQTGHLVLSTLHTNDAASTICRLTEMGIEPFLLNSSLVMICAQRLVRKLCNNCKKEYLTSDLESELLNLEAGTSIYRPVGCSQCNQIGYQGRVGIHEILVPNDLIRTAINREGISPREIKQLAVEAGMKTLFQDALNKVCLGVTSMEEVLTKVRQDD